MASALADEYFNKGNGSRAHTLAAIGNCHIDSAWLWPYTETKRKVARSFSSQLALMDRYPEHIFVASQVQLLWVFNALIIALCLYNIGMCLKGAYLGLDNVNNSLIPSSASPPGSTVAVVQAVLPRTVDTCVGKGGRGALPACRGYLGRDGWQYTQRWIFHQTVSHGPDILPEGARHYLQRVLAAGHLRLLGTDSCSHECEFYLGYFH